MGEERRVVRNHGGPIAGHAQVRRMKSTRWTEARQIAFLEHLAVTANVAAAAEAAGMSKVQVYRIRRRDPAFRAAWSEALRQGYEALEIVLLHRAMHGVERPVFHGGAQIGTVREYSDAVAVRLLQLHRATVDGARARDLDSSEEPPELAIEEIRAKLEEMRVRRAALAAPADESDGVG